ncbi:Osmosensitive K+ channel histidine kinase KdpD [Enterobacter hormaechei]|nr:Osmosensitive K+ channel histidine kinase KdpD [Enterobacter hormaechei]
MTDEPMRPDPDRLLEQTAEAHRGKLKIFLAPARVSGKPSPC